jgi:hypothetical protein
VAADRGRSCECQVVRGRQAAAAMAHPWATAASAPPPPARPGCRAAAEPQRRPQAAAAASWTAWRPPAAGHRRRHPTRGLLAPLPHPSGSRRPSWRAPRSRCRCALPASGPGRAPAAGGASRSVACQQRPPPTAAAYEGTPASFVCERRCFPRAMLGRPVSWPFPLHTLGPLKAHRYLCQQCAGLRWRMAAMANSGCALQCRLPHELISITVTAVLIRMAALRPKFFTTLSHGRLPDRSQNLQSSEPCSCAAGGVPSGDRVVLSPLPWTQGNWAGHQQAGTPAKG